jgi:hypothetical protein
LQAEGNILIDGRTKSSRKSVEKARSSVKNDSVDNSYLLPLTEIINVPTHPPIVLEKEKPESTSRTARRQLPNKGASLHPTGKVKVQR